MRIAWICLLSFFVLAGCTHGATVPPVVTPSGDVSTYPVFVIDPRSTRATDDGAVEVTGPFRACAATYVAPRLLVTSATAFPELRPGARRTDVPVIVRTADGGRLHAELAYLDGGDGIAILRTWETGRPFRLSGRIPLDGEVLKAFGYVFGPVPADKSLPPTELYIQPVRALEEPYSDGPRFVRFRIDTQLRAGSCGAPLLDRDGKLAGIVHERHGEWMSAISSASIATVIESL